MHMLHATQCWNVNETVLLDVIRYEDVLPLAYTFRPWIFSPASRRIFRPTVFSVIFVVRSFSTLSAIFLVRKTFMGRTAKCLGSETSRLGAKRQRNEVSSIL